VGKAVKHLITKSTAWDKSPKIPQQQKHNIITGSDKKGKTNRLLRVNHQNPERVKWVSLSCTRRTPKKKQQKRKSPPNGRLQHGIAKNTKASAERPVNPKEENKSKRKKRIEDAQEGRRDQGKQTKKLKDKSKKP